MLLDEKLPMFLYHERGNILIEKGPGPMNIRIASRISGTIHTYPDPHIDRDPLRPEFRSVTAQDGWIRNSDSTRQVA